MKTGCLSNVIKELKGPIIIGMTGASGRVGKGS